MNILKISLEINTVGKYTTQKQYTFKSIFDSKKYATKEEKENCKWNRFIYGCLTFFELAASDNCEYIEYRDKKVRCYVVNVVNLMVI